MAQPETIRSNNEKGNKKSTRERGKDHRKRANDSEGLDTLNDGIDALDPLGDGGDLIDDLHRGELGD